MKTNSNANEDNGNSPDADLRQRIEERAYHIWLEGGRGDGDHERHWLQAEREVTETAKKEREQRSDVRNVRNAGKPHKEQAPSMKQTQGTNLT